MHLDFGTALTALIMLHSSAKIVHFNIMMRRRFYVESENIQEDKMRR